MVRLLNHDPATRAESRESVMPSLDKRGIPKGYHIHKGVFTVFTQRAINYSDQLAATINLPHNMYWLKQGSDTTCIAI